MNSATLVVAVYFLSTHYYLIHFVSILIYLVYQYVYVMKIKILLIFTTRKIWALIVYLY